MRLSARSASPSSFRSSRFNLYSILPEGLFKALTYSGFKGPQLSIDFKHWTLFLRLLCHGLILAGLCGCASPALTQGPAPQCQAFHEQTGTVRVSPPFAISAALRAYEGSMMGCIVERGSEPYCFKHKDWKLEEVPNE